MKLNTKKKGFTLIELLIVMAIIGVIIAMTIVGYSSVNKRIALDIAANRIENMIIEMREKTRSGYIEPGENITEASSLCFGFEVEEQGMLNQLMAPYDRLKEKNNQCIEIESENYGLTDINESIVIKDLEIFGEKIKDYRLFFAPPDAVIEIEEGSITSDDKLLKIIIGLRGNDNENDQRVIILNMLTGNTFTDRFNEKYE